jgi:DNA-binding transcriptional LysR family regulator
MELRVLRYFLAVAREESITGAAEALHVTQPTLSKQLMDLEQELGKKLFIRGNRKITLTEEGMFLRRRAQEIIDLTDKTQAEFQDTGEIISGDIYIGGGETEGMRLVGKVIKRLQAEHPNIRYHLFSGNAIDVSERLDKGLLDFGIFIEPADITKYDFLKLPTTDTWGVLMRKDSSLAAHKTIKPEDLAGLPLLASRQSIAHNDLSGWLGKNYEDLNIVTTYNLLYNASLLVEENVGYALCLDKIVREYDSSVLCFRPLEPRIEVGLDIVWKKYQVFSKAAEKFLEVLQREISSEAL